MTVLVCIPCLLVGGTEVQTLNLVRALAGAGHRVVTAAYFEHCSQMADAYRKAGSEVILLSPDGSRPAGRRKYALLWRGLRRAVKTVRPDVAHVQYMAPGAIPILMLRAMGVKRIIATAHTAADIYRSLRLIHMLQRHVLRAFTCITCRAESSFFGSYTLYSPQMPLSRRNHFTIYNSLPEYITIAPPRSVVTDTITIGVVSRLEHIKGMDLVIPAFAMVAKKHPHCRLLVVGDGSLRTVMEQQALEEGVADRIEFAGRQGAATIQSYYDRIDILLMPSRSEGFGLTAIEGMARGCVPVVADVGGLPEVVIDGECGLLHRPEDPVDIARKISGLLASPTLLQKMSRAATDRACSFTFERYASAFASLYSRLFE